MSGPQCLPFEVGGLRFDVQTGQAELAAYLDHETCGSWAVVSKRPADLVVTLLTDRGLSDLPADGETLFGSGETAILGRRLAGGPPAWATGHMRLRPVSRRRVDLIVLPDPLASFIALYRVISTVLKARVLAAGGAELHASAIGGHDRIVAFVGPKGAGKTSLCMDFVLSQRATFVANDHILLLPSDPVGVVSLPETLRIGQGTVSQHEVLRALAARTGRGFGSDGKTRIHVSEIAPLLHDPPDFSGSLAAIVTCTFDSTVAQGGALERASNPSTTVSDALTGVAEHVRPAWIEELDACASRRSDAEALSLDCVPTFRLRRAKGDTYAPLRLARSLRSVLDADLTGEPI